MIKARVWLPLLMLAGAFVYWGWLRHGEGEKPQQPQRIVPVRTAPVEAIDAAPTLRLSGKLAANRAVQISPEVTGKLSRILVQSGQQVAAGAVLLHLDSARQQAAHAELAANLRNELRKLRDMEKLVGRGAVTPSEREGQEASVAMARARLQGAEVELAQRTLTAPFAGTVSLIDLSVGAWVGVGDPLLHLDDIAHLRLDLAVPERYLSLLRPGMAVAATSSAWPGKFFAGTVEVIDSRISEASQSIRVRIGIDNEAGQLKPGMLLDVVLSLPAQQITRIPAQAVEYAGKQRFVYRLEGDGRVSRVAVDLKDQQGSAAWVTSGLKAGERVVVEGLVNLRDGARVRDLAGEQG